MEDIKQFDDYEAFEALITQEEGGDSSQDEVQILIDNKKHTKRGEGKSLKFESDGAYELLDFMFKHIVNQSKTTVRSYLKNNQVRINGIPTTKFDAFVSKGDIISINLGIAQKEFRHNMLQIVYEDDHIIVANKKNGLLTMATDRERKRTAYFILSEYLKSKDRGDRIFIVHRLDRETSGLVLFAKSIEVQHALQKNWSDNVLERKYVAVVGGHPQESSGVVHSYLKENKAFVVYSTNESDGEEAITNYRVLESSRTKSLIELELETGKKNQIRVHLKDLGCPILGDKKYGGEPSPMGRVMLHASRIRFIHPATDQEMLFDTGIPSSFRKFFFFKG